MIIEFTTKTIGEGDKREECLVDAAEGLINKLSTDASWPTDEFVIDPWSKGEYRAAYLGSMVNIERGSEI